MAVLSLKAHATSRMPFPKRATRRSEFNQYLDTTDELSDRQALVQWWGVSACFIDVSLFRV